MGCFEYVRTAWSRIASLKECPRELWFALASAAFIAFADFGLGVILVIHLQDIGFTGTDIYIYICIGGREGGRWREEGGRRREREVGVGGGRSCRYLSPPPPPPSPSPSPLFVLSKLFDILYIIVI